MEQSCGDREIVLRLSRVAWPYHVLSWLALIFLGVFLVGIYIFIRLQVWIATTEFGLTNRKVVYKEGLFTRTTHEIPMTSLDEVEVYQNFWGRILGYGRLRLWGSGRGELCSPPINDPVTFRSELSDVRARIIQPKDSQPEYIDSLLHADTARKKDTPTDKSARRRRRQRATAIAEWN